MPPHDRSFRSIPSIVGTCVVGSGLWVAIASGGEYERTIGAVVLVVIGLGVIDTNARSFLLEILEIVFRSRSSRKQSGTADSGEPHELPEEDREPEAPEQRFEVARVARPLLLDLLGPTYILNKYFQFVDWNPTFEELVAKPLGLQRGRHASTLVRRLKNAAEIEDRAKQDFVPEHYPLQHVEELVLDTGDRYGDVRFQKIAAQIADDRGDILAWSVNLNIVGGDRIETLWADMQAVLDEQVKWSKYAMSYDKLLLAFDDYDDLLNQVVDRINPACSRCVDLGAGTGNLSLKLLQSPEHNCRVWAVEQNYSMIESFNRKLERLESEGNALRTRLHLVRQNVGRLDYFPDEYFDTAVMVNVFYALDDKASALDHIHRVLRPNGKLILTTSNTETDVPRLFSRMREVLEQKGMFDELKENFESAKVMHDVMDDMIHADTRQQIREYLLQDGRFEIEEFVDRAYVDAVVLVNARKR